MLCCHCKKNQATKTYDRITDGKKQTEYYCLDCYHRLFISIEADAAEGKGGDRQIAMCPYCGTSEEDFRACGLVGCAQCYQSLSKAVIPVVIRLQGTETHCGKKPRNSGEREEMVRRRNLLKTRVEELIKNRSYEAAKMCSDELKRLNKLLYKEGPDD